MPLSNISPARSRRRPIEWGGQRCVARARLGREADERAGRGRPTGRSRSCPSRRDAAAVELGRALWFTDRIADALAVFQQALDEVDRKRDPDVHELLRAELISASWWHAQTYPIAEAAVAELKLDALHGGVGSEVLLATMAHYELDWGCTASSQSSLARRALASGKCLMASGSVAFYLRGERLARAAWEAVSSRPGAHSGSPTRGHLQRRGHTVGVAGASRFAAIFGPRSPI